MMDSLSALTVTLPASPVPVAVEPMPVKEKAGFFPVPSTDRRSATSTVTLPPLPDPLVVLEITPLAAVAGAPCQRPDTVQYRGDGPDGHVNPSLVIEMHQRQVEGTRSTRGTSWHASVTINGVEHRADTRSGAPHRSWR